MNAQPTELHYIPLTQLRISPRNARKTGGAGVNDLAASIKAHGLLQNLGVEPSGNEADVFEVVAGGRRLQAMQLLAQSGELPSDLAGRVPCRVIHDQDLALEASTAENTLREAMHPADQFDAFKAMIDIGRPLPDVAAHFGVPESVVKQRLKLANVNPQLVQLYREGGMSLEQLQALALTDNHEMQRQAWFATKHDWERNPHNLRDFITRSEVNGDSVLARFVGIDAYVEAGGSVRSDLFSTRVWLQDGALLQRLATAKLEEVAGRERAAGWSWVEVHLSLDYSQRAEYPKGGEPLVTRFASPEDEERNGACEARISEIELLPGNDLTEEQEDALSEEKEHLQDELDAITGRMVEEYAPELLAKAGVLVYLDSGQGLVIARGRLQPGQKLSKATGAVTGAPSSDKGPKAKPATLSGAVMLNLSAHRSEVARYHVARDPQLALALLVDWYAARLKGDYSDHGLLNMSGTTVNDAEKVAPDLHKALRDESTLPAAAFKKIPKVGRLAWLVKLPQAELMQMLAYCVASRFSGVTERDEGHEGIAQLHAIVGFDMADHWHPGCDNFLGRIPAALTHQAVAEAKGKQAAAALHGLKKDGLVAEAGKLLAGTGWLPAPLRGPTYDAKSTPAKTSKTPAKPVAKSTAKKSPVKKKAAPKAAPKKKPAKKK